MAGSPLFMAKPLSSTVGVMLPVREKLPVTNPPGRAPPSNRATEAPHSELVLPNLRLRRLKMEKPTRYYGIFSSILAQYKGNSLVTRKTL